MVRRMNQPPVLLLANYLNSTISVIFAEPFDAVIRAAVIHNYDFDIRLILVAIMVGGGDD